MATRRERRKMYPGWVCIVLVAGCGAPKLKRPTRPLILAVSGDTQGWIVPCGCESHQSGGLLRRGTLLGQLGPGVDVIYVDVGGAPDGIAPYDQLKFEAILKGELISGLDAHNIGAGEARLGADYLRALKTRLKVPLVSCNVRDKAGNFVGDPFRIADGSGWRIGLIGVLSDRKQIVGVVIDSALDSILAAIGKAAGQYDSLVVLAYMPEDELVQLAENLPEVDVIVGGPTNQCLVPRRAGPVLLASATNKGKFMVLLYGSSSESGARWDGKVVELTDAFADDSRQKDNLNDFRALLAQRNFTPAQTSFTATIPATLPDDVGVAGTESCVGCHVEDARIWRASKHACAWRSLMQTGAEVDPYCQRCHTTGYGLPGGFRSVRVPARRVAVGCESCHGPSRAHTDKPEHPTAWRGQAKNQCRRCHDHENSPRFEFDAYWDQIRHGASPAGPTTEGKRVNEPERSRS